MTARGAWVALALALSCRGAPPPREKVVVANAQLPQSGLVFVAQARGDFAAEGLDVTVRSYQFGRPALAAALAGEADVATVAETPLVFATLQGARPSVLATISRSTRDYSILARRAAGIALPRDLVGRRIGVSRGTSGEFFLDSALVRNAIRRSAVTIVDLGPNEMEGALREGAVDAVATWNPQTGHLLRRLAGELVVVGGETGCPEMFQVVTRSGFAVKRRAAAEGLLRALLRAEAFVRERPQEARAMVAAGLGIDPAALAEVWDVYELRVGLEQNLYVLLEQETRWAVRSGLVPRQDTPDYREVVAPDPLLAVRPDAVHLIR